MKDYPSIPGSIGQKFREMADAAVFDKLDGSSMRSEWNKKRGWYKHGRRHGLLDGSNEQLIIVPELFREQLEESLTKVAVDNRWQSMIVFYEFWGEKRFAGSHEKGDPKFLTVFDATVDKKGFLGPVDFRKTFEDLVATPRYLGSVNWTREYVESVRTGMIDGVTFEGVVAKSGSKHQIVRSKAKTQAWIDAVAKKYGHDSSMIDS